MINVIDLCSGIGTFPYANSKLKHSPFKFIGCAEIKPFCNQVLQKHGHELIGDVMDNFVPEANNHKSQYCYQNDLVYSEEFGESPITMEDLMEGVVDWPDMAIVGSPCQDITPANTQQDQGINGERSSIIHPILDRLEFLDCSYFILENSGHLTTKGLCHLVERLDSIGYIVEWEKMACTGWGYPYYRHRIFVVAYKPNTAPDLLNETVFEHVRRAAKYNPGDKFPLADQHSDELIQLSQVMETKGNNRRNRIDALGNAINVDIAASILHALASLIKRAEAGEPASFGFEIPFKKFYLADLETKSNTGFRKMPSRGYMRDGAYFTGDNDTKVNPATSAFNHLSTMPALVANDKKNNFTSNSRTTRNGTLGGLVGCLQTYFGFTQGGLNPDYCEPYMGFPVGYTEL